MTCLIIRERKKGPKNLSKQKLNTYNRNYDNEKMANRKKTPFLCISK